MAASRTIPSEELATREELDQVFKEVKEFLNYLRVEKERLKTVDQEAKDATRKIEFIPSLETFMIQLEMVDLNSRDPFIKVTRENLKQDIEWFRKVRELSIAILKPDNDDDKTSKKQTRSSVHPSEEKSERKIEITPTVSASHTQIWKKPGMSVIPKSIIKKCLIM